MKLTYLVNAMILFESEQSRVLCDPWVTFDTKSHSNLYNFPELKMTREQIAAIKPDYIYITHTHADHLDPPTLSLFSRDTPIIISHYENNFTERNVRALGFTDVRVSDPEKGLPLNGDDHCWLEPSMVYSDVDSLGIFRLDGKIVVNANDNPFHEEHCRSIRERFGEVFLACVPFSAQGPYPAFYENLTLEERANESQKKKERGYKAMLGYVEQLKPEYTFPFAAGAIYGNKKALLSPYYGVGTQEEAISALEKQVQGTKLVTLASQCSFDFVTLKREGNQLCRTYDTEHDYIKRVANEPTIYDRGGLFYIDPSEQIDLTKLLTRARQKQAEWQKRKNILSDAVFFIDTGQAHLYRLSLADTTVSKVKESDITDEAYEIIRLPYSLMIGLLTAHYNYSNVKTQYMSFYRKPNLFNPDIHVLMSFLQL